MKNILLYKVMSIIWLIFGCLFLLLPMIVNGTDRSKVLSIIAAILFFLNSYMNLKKSKQALNGPNNEE